MARKALDTLLLGILGEIHAGETVPETYKDLLGAEHKTDFKRLEDLGYVEPVKRPAPAPDPVVEAENEAKVAAQPTPPAEPPEHKAKAKAAKPKPPAAEKSS